MKKIIAAIVLFVFFSSCTEEPQSETKKLFIPTQNLDYGINAFKVRFKEDNFFVLMNEDDFYYFLNGLSVVKSKHDYFLKRKEIKGTAIVIDSITFLNFKSKMVFLDSCDENIVAEWVSKIENNADGIKKPILVDSAISRINLNCIYYNLLADSFKIYQEDVSGNYIIDK